MRLEREGDTSAQLLKFVRGSEDDESDLTHKVWRQHCVLDLSRFLGKAIDHMLHVFETHNNNLGKFKVLFTGNPEGRCPGQRQTGGFLEVTITSKKY